MKDKTRHKSLDDIKAIVEQLHDLLHEDALHRLQLYQKYAQEPDDTKWSPNLYQRCQLVESLRQKLYDFN